MTDVTHSTRVEHPRAARARTIAGELRAGCAMTDRQFDLLYPVAARAMSSSYWTPVRVALRAAGLLVEHAGDRVLDIGSGVGKFCWVGAATTAGVFHGIEQRADLVHYARESAALLEGGSVAFVQGAFDGVRAHEYDAFYLFNPFEENTDRKLAAADRRTVDGDDWFLDDVERARAFLASARPGARVVTYNGMGGPLPDCYELVHRERLRCVLDLWIKRP